MSLRLGLTPATTPDGESSTNSYSNWVCSEASLMRRYDLCQDDIDELLSHIQVVGIGNDSVTRACTSFYFVDYGVPQE